MEDTFAKDVERGLLANPKFLQSKYFYDDNGSRIFQEIMQMPEYYLTDSEFEILSLQSNKILEAVDFDVPFNIIELGAGDGFKTFKLLEYVVKKNLKVTYIPIDISQEAMESLSQSLEKRLPDLKVEPKVGDYFSILKKMEANGRPNLLLFLGSNIGNYKAEEAKNLLHLFNENMKMGDKILVGIDLKKNPSVIFQAYSDPHGITKKFNLNLLIRMNRELQADFQIEDFDFYCHYNPISGEVRSYLVSLKDQYVKIGAIEKTIHFKRNEIIWTELSKKYDTEEIEMMAQSTGFKVLKNFVDCKHYFADSLWQKV